MMQVEWADVRHVRRIGNGRYEISIDLKDDYLIAYDQAVLNDKLEIAIRPTQLRMDDIILRFSNLQPMGSDLGMLKVINLWATLE